MITSPHDYQAYLYSLNNPNHRLQITKLPNDEPIYKVDLNKRTIKAPEFLSVNLDHNAETIFFEVDRYFENVDLAEMTCILSYINANPNKKENGFIYHPPFIDIITKPGKIIIPWFIEGPATLYGGDITFAIQFYHLSKTYDGMTAKEYESFYGEDNLPEYKKVGRITKEQFNNKFYYLKNSDSECYYNENYDENKIYFERKTAAEIEKIKIGYSYDYNLNTLPAKSKILHGMKEIINEGNNNYNYQVDTLKEIWDAINNIKSNYEDKNILYWTILY